MSQETVSPDLQQSQEALMERQKKERNERRLRRLKILFPFLLLLVFLVYAFTTNYIPSESMLPTLKPGDHILTMRTWLAYPFKRMPARGDIIVFVLPKEQEEEGGEPPGGPEEGEAGGGRSPIGIFRKPKGDILIKRVVGLPGESVQIKGDAIYINGRKLPDDIRPKMPAMGDEYGYYAVAEPLKLGPDELFVLGDNPENSDDGRFWGPLKRNNVLGKFIRVLWHEGEGGPNRQRAEENRENADR